MFASRALSSAAKIAIVVALCATYAAIVVTAWLSLVPGVFSRQTFAWIGLLAVTSTIAAAWAIASARPTRSIAHVLYEAENPAPHPSN